MKPPIISTPVGQENQLCFYDGFKLESSCPKVIEAIKQQDEKYLLRHTIYRGYTILIKGQWYPYPDNLYKIDIEIKKNNKGVEVVQFSGSFHKMFEKGTNYQPFYWRNFLGMCEIMEKKFGLSDSEVRVINLEIGPNNNIPPIWNISAKTLTRNCYVFKGKGIKKTENYDGLGFIKKFEKDQYCLKLYDKSMQNGLEERNIWRVEMKCTTSIKLKTCSGIKTLWDLKGYTNHNKAMFAVVNLIDDLVIFQEELLTLVTNETDLAIVKSLSTEKQWEDLHKQGRYVYRDTRKKYESIVDKYCPYNYRKELKKMMLALMTVSPDPTHPFSTL